MNNIAYGIIALTALYVVIGRTDRVLARSLMATVFLMSFVPQYAAPYEVILVANAAAILLMITALAMQIRDVRIPGIAILPLALIVIDGVGRLRGGSLNLAIYNTVLEVTLALAVVVATSVFAQHGVTPFLRALAFVIPLQLGVSVLEQMGTLYTLWARGDWLDDIANRPQTLITFFLNGRSMGSMGHPIPLGVIGALGVVASILLARSEKKRGYYVITAMALIVLGLSGTRSAVTALAIALVYLFFRNTNPFIRLIVTVIAIMGWLTFGNTGILSNESVETLTNSTSYTHRTNIISDLAGYVSSATSDQLLYGMGAYDYVSLFQTGVFSGGADLSFFDNQVVRQIVTVGIFGTIIMFLTIVIGLIRGRTVTHTLMFFMLPLFISFDLFTWQSSFLYFVIIVSMMLATPSRKVAPGDVEGGVNVVDSAPVRAATTPSPVVRAARVPARPALSRNRH